MFNSKKIEKLENKVNSLQEKVHSLLNDQLSEVTYNQDSLRSTLEVVLKETVKNNEILAYILKNMQGQDKLTFAKQDSSSDSLENNQIEQPVKRDAKRKRSTTNIYNYFVTVKIPNDIMEYLLEKSNNTKKSTSIKRVFNRNGKLVLCPISPDVVDKIRTAYLSKNLLGLVVYDRYTVAVSKEMFDAFHKISEILNMKMINVTTAFVYSLSFNEYNRVKEAFNVMLTEQELQTSK